MVIVGSIWLHISGLGTQSEGPISRHLEVSQVTNISKKFLLLTFMKRLKYKF